MARATAHALWYSGRKQWPSPLAPADAGSAHASQNTPRPDMSIGNSVALGTVSASSGVSATINRVVAVLCTPSSRHKSHGIDSGAGTVLENNMGFSPGL